MNSRMAPALTHHRFPMGLDSQPTRAGVCLERDDEGQRLEKVRDKMQGCVWRRWSAMQSFPKLNTINVSVGDTYSLDLHLNSVAPIHGRGARAVQDAGFYARRTSARD